MPTVTSENREEFNSLELGKKLPTKNKPGPKNDFYSKYKNVITPHKEYPRFVEHNMPHIKEHTEHIRKQVKSFTGLNENQKNKKFHERMKDAANHVTETWDFTKPTN